MAPIAVSLELGCSSEPRFGLALNIVKKLQKISAMNTDSKLASSSGRV